MSEPGFCRWCVGFLLTLGVAIFLIWLSYRPLHPRYFLIAFQLPPIANRTAAAAGNNVTATLSFALEVENKNKHMGVDHDDLAVFFSYGNHSGSATIPGFYQGHSKTAEKAGMAGVGWVPWGAAAKEVAAKGAAVFRVGVVTRYRYKALLWKGRRHRVSVGADVEVDGEGRKTARKGIRLRSAVPRLRVGAWPALAVAAAVLVVLPPPLMLF